MFREFSGITIVGSLGCSAGLCFLLLITSGLSVYLHLEILYPNFFTVLMVAFPALLWEIWCGRPAIKAQPLAKQISLVIIAILYPSLYDIAHSYVVLSAIVGVWCMGTLGLYLGSRMKS